jgi:hypothetical protein
MLSLLLVIAAVHAGGSHCGYLEDQINMLIENASAFGVSNATLNRVTNEYLDEACGLTDSTFSGFKDGWAAGINDYNFTNANICNSDKTKQYDPQYCKGYNTGYLDSLTLTEDDLSDVFYKQYLDKHNITQSVSSP